MYGVTDAGFVRKPLDTIKSELEAKWRGIFGQAVDLDPAQPDGQIIGVISGLVDELWQVGEGVYNSLRPSTAQGVPLDQVSAFNGISRSAGQPTFVSVQLTIPSGSVQVVAGQFVVESDAGDQFVSRFSQLHFNGALVPMASVENGRITVGPGEITKIVTPLPGLTAITNPSAQSQIGFPDESDVELRLRRANSTEQQSINTTEALLSALVATPEITRQLIVENATTGTVDGRPPHTFEVIAIGGTDQQVADLIWENRPIGIQSIGSSNAIVTDSQGTDHAISFTRPAPIEIWVDLLLSIDADFPSTGADEIKQAIVDWSTGAAFGSGIDIGEDVKRSRLFTPINSIPGHSVTTLEIGLSAVALGTADIPIDEIEIASFAISRITVTF